MLEKDCDVHKFKFQSVDVGVRDGYDKHDPESVDWQLVHDTMILDIARWKEKYNGKYEGYLFDGTFYLKFFTTLFK